MSDDTTRRQFLAATAATGAAGLAGCLGGSGGGTETSMNDDGMSGDSPTDGGTMATSFTVTVTNVSSGETLQTEEGGKPVPLAPLAWAVHGGANPLFTEGEKASTGLERLAEDGTPKELVKAAKMDADKTGAAAVPMGANGPGPINPGGSYQFTVEAHAGQKLSLASMFVQSNDLFYAPGAEGIALFDGDDEPVSGDVTDALGLWDAGTEVNQPPGTGSDQAPRQESKGAGTEEDGTVRPVADVDDGYDYPDDEDVIMVEIAPGSMDG